MIIAWSIDRRLASQTTVLAARRALFSAGSSSEIRTAIMPITTSNSTSVKPLRCLLEPICRRKRIDPFLPKNLEATSLNNQCSTSSGMQKFLLRRRWFYSRPRLGIMAHHQAVTVRAKCRTCLAELFVQNYPGRVSFGAAVRVPVAGFGRVTCVLPAGGQDRDGFACNIAMLKCFVVR